MSVIANLFAILATFPILPFLIVYLVFRLVLVSESKEAIGWAINITTLFLISSNTRLINMLGKQDAGGGLWWVLIVFVAIGVAVAYLQYAKRRQIEWPRLLRASWRLGFLSLSILYVVLFVINISVTIFS